MNTFIQTPLHFTSEALEQIGILKSTLHIAPDQYLRIGVKGGGCAGMSFLLAFDHKEEQDNTYSIQGLDVVINKAHAMYVIGMEIGWENSDAGKGFVFHAAPNL